MVQACNATGVQVIVDVVINHMAGTHIRCAFSALSEPACLLNEMYFLIGIDSGSGVAGHLFTHYNYPGIYSSQVRVFMASGFFSLFFHITMWESRCDDCGSLLCGIGLP